jgi:nitroreductase
MDLEEALRTTSAVREFTDQAVPDEVLWQVLDTARFAPSGGNRQGWRVIVVKDAQIRRRLRDLYLPGWYEYLAISSAGLVPWAPVTDREAEVAAARKAPEVEAASRQAGGGFAEHLDEVPVLLVLLAAVDRDFEHYTLVGGASIYPFAWSVLLAGRERGLGGVFTTMAVRQEPEVKALLHVPDEMAVAGVMALGYPARRATRLRRSPVEGFASVDRANGVDFAAR